MEDQYAGMLGSTLREVAAVESPGLSDAARDRLIKDKLLAQVPTSVSARRMAAASVEDHFMQAYHRRALDNVAVRQVGPSFSVSDVVQILQNVGISVKCGACMELAFTGVTTSGHTCA